MSTKVECTRRTFMGALPICAAAVVGARAVTAEDEDCAPSISGLAQVADPGIIRLGLEMFISYRVPGGEWIPLPYITTYIQVPAGFNPRLIRVVESGPVAKYFAGVDKADRNRLFLVSMMSGDGLSSLRGIHPFDVRIIEHLDGSRKSSNVFWYRGCRAFVSTFSPGEEECVLDLADITYERETRLCSGPSATKDVIDERYSGKRS